jgi:hypothetical protein
MARWLWSVEQHAAHAFEVDIFEEIHYLTSSLAAAMIAIYSASQVDRDTMDCSQVSHD